MNQTKEIVLGYTKQVYKYNDESEDEDEFPSKIGGSPEQKCQSIRAFRTQISKNQEIEATPHADSTTIFLKKQFKLITNMIGIKELQNVWLRIEEKINAFNVPNENFYKDKEKDKKINFDKENELIKNYTENVLKAEKDEIPDFTDDEDDDDDEEIVDRNFFIYNEFMKEYQYPTIIYCMDKKSLPLWYSDTKIWQETEVKQCDRCGQPRIFEFQITNELLNEYSDFIEFDWGIITVYSCPNSCAFIDEFAEELVIVQACDVFEANDLKDPKFIEKKQKEIHNQMIQMQQEEGKWEDDDDQIQEQEQRKNQKKKKNKKKQQNINQIQQEEDNGDDW